MHDQMNGTGLFCTAVNIRVHIYAGSLKQICINLEGNLKFLFFSCFT